MENLKSVLNRSEWSRVLEEFPGQGGEKWLTYLRLALFEILDLTDESLHTMEKLFDFAHFVVEAEEIGKNIFYKLMHRCKHSIVDN